MKAIIPVAGYGTRLKPHTNSIQKTLIPVAGKPVIDHIVSGFLKFGIQNITFIVGHLGYQVKEYMAQYDGNFTFVEQKETLGLGHAVLQGLNDTDEPVIIQLGDSIFNADYRQLIKSEYHNLAVMEVEDPKRFGVIDHQDGAITGFYEKVDKPPTNLAISGLYFIKNESRLKQSILSLIEQNIQTKNEYQLTDALTIMLQNGEKFNYFKLKNWYDVGIPETFLDTNRKLIKSTHGNFSGSDLSEPVAIGKNCIIKSSRIGPNVTIMDDCEIVDCTIKESIILSSTSLRGENINNAIIGPEGRIIVE